MSNERRPLPHLPTPATLAASTAAAFLAALVSLTIFALHPHLEPGLLEVAALVGQLTLLYLPPFLVSGWLGGWLLRRLGKPGWEGGLAGILLVMPLAWFVIWGAREEGARHRETPSSDAGDQGVVEPGDPDPPPVILLVVDGLDPQLLGELVEAGQLPTFERLLEEGTSGPLGSLQPTLSPLLWTSLATGRLPRDHGVHHFVRHRVPGLSLPLDRFPPRSGLTHHLVPWLEELSWSGWRAVPYTSLSRRSRALWEIAGEYFPVGVYRWLVTWPAEPVEGFLVAGGLWASPRRGFGQGEDRPGDSSVGQAWHPEGKEWTRSMEGRVDQPRDQGWTWPPELEGELPPLRDPVRRRELLPYLSDGTTPDLRDPDQRFIARSLRDPTLRDLVYLVARHRPKLLAAAFYSVDAFGHRFVDQHRDGGPYGPALAARYRHSDRMLGRFLDRLDTIYERPYHLLVVSDHGWDLAAGHHFSAPAGVVIARGPHFAAGRRVAGASLLDITPLVLRLLALPVAEDMPGRDTHHALLSPMSALPLDRLLTWEREARREEGAADVLDQKQRRELESLGYLP